MTDRLEFALSVLYGQVHACRAGHPAPGSIWTPDHVAQGFAWRPEAVSFGVPDHDGECLLRAGVAGSGHRVSDDAIWALRVPFVSTTGEVEVGGIVSAETFRVPPGPHALHFEALPGEGGFAYALRMAFVPDGLADFAILRRGGGVGAASVLRVDAEQA